MAITIKDFNQYRESSKPSGSEKTQAELRAEIEQHVAEFLARGGVITQVDPGECTTHYDNLIREENRALLKKMSKRQIVSN